MPVNLDVELPAGSVLRGNNPRDYQRQDSGALAIIDGIAVPELSDVPHCASNLVSSAEGKITLRLSVDKSVGVIQFPHAIGGIRSAHGRAASKAAAARKMSTSLMALEMTCKPTGRPSPVNPTGKDAAGLPFRLNG